MKKNSILVVDYTTPRPDQDAGSVTAFYILQLLRQMGHDVTFVPTDGLDCGNYTKALSDIGIDVVLLKSFAEFLTKNTKSFDVAIVSRVTVAYSAVPLIREKMPNIKIIFNTVDLHHLREHRQAELQNDETLRKHAAQTRKQELSTMQKSDATIVLSSAEIEVVKAMDASLHLFEMPLILDIPGRNVEFNDRSNILFIGGFDHLPNIDAVQYFVRDVWPIIHSELPNCRFKILGSKPTDVVRRLGDEYVGVDVIGFVQDLGEYFDKVRLSVAPLRFGAGIKGKIGTSFSYGVPCVATTLAIEGMSLQENVEVLVADDPVEFARKAVKIYRESDLWLQMSKAGVGFAEKNYSLRAGARRLSALLQEVLIA